MKELTIHVGRNNDISFTPQSITRTQETDIESYNVNVTYAMYRFLSGSYLGPLIGFWDEGKYYYLTARNEIITKMPAITCRGIRS